MERRRLGRTGHDSSVAILGGAAFGRSDAETTEASFAAALAAGVNHLDVAPQYGRAQELLGPLIPAVRDQLFVACKTLRHHPDGVRAQLEDSLELLHCDSFDLYQLHAVTDLVELDARDGAVRAILAARDEGLTRWVGITGHEHTTPAAISLPPSGSRFSRPMEIAQCGMPCRKLLVPSSGSTTQRQAHFSDPLAPLSSIRKP